MRDISEVDSNLKVDTEVDKSGLRFYDVSEEPFKVYGVIKENGMYRRLPKAVAKEVNEGIYRDLHTNTAGGRVRFKTNSKTVVISAIMSGVACMGHMPMTGSAGFDMYIQGEYYHTFVPPATMKNGYESRYDFKDNKMRDIIINFPLYSNVLDLKVGVDEGTEIQKGEEYKIKKPVLYYGSSITQGGCASRPGNSYQSVISRKLDCDFINLGFSGNALGEESIANYIADTDMSVFVYDYDHNAPTAEHLKSTHKRMFDIIRSKQPNLPVIFVTRPTDCGNAEETKVRRDVIYDTYITAKNSGDNNVYFADGNDIFNYIDRHMFSVDGCHPNDFGFWCMAEVIGKLVKEALPL